MANGITYLVDGSGYIFRAFYAISPLTTSSGFPTNALFGFTRMLKKLMVDADSENIAVAFDVGRETFRLQMFPEYKANRKECPQELIPQLPYFRDIAAALGLPILELPGFEADDIIGTLAVRLAKAGCQVVIVSGDKDLMQFIGPNISMWDTMHDKYYASKDVVEKFGVGPDRVVEVLALTGDSSDNVPGLAGVGPKTAAQLIEKYGNIEAVICAVDEIRLDKSIRNREKISAAIESGTEILRLSRRLVEINTASPVSLILDGKISDVGALDDAAVSQALRRSNPDATRLRELSQKFEFRSLLDDLPLEIGSAESEPPGGATYRTIGAREFDSWLQKLDAQSEFAFDTETTSLDVFEARLVGASFCWSDNEAFYIPIGHREGGDQVELEVFLKALSPILANAKIGKIGQNVKFDLKVLARQGLIAQGPLFDCMVAAYLLNPDRGSYNLTALANELLKLPVVEFEEIVGGQPDFSYVNIGAATRYAAQDAHYAWLLKQHLEKRIQVEGLQRVLGEIEMPLVSVLARMELEGVEIDQKLLAKMSGEFAEELAAIEKQIYELAGCEFNINSPKQLAGVLFDKLCIPVKGVKKTKTGVSTDSSVLEKISPLHPVPALVLQYRSIHKLKSTYVDALPAQVSVATGRLHTHFNQAATGTGRLSSSEPNLQNIPVQTKEGRRIREAFVSRPGTVFISADYSQIELRLLAHMSHDKNMIAAFVGDTDIHAQTARELFGIKSNQDLTSEQRRFGKTINFGIIYGMGAFRLARELAIPVSAASTYIDEYFNHYPRVREFFEQLEKEAGQKGYVRTIYGRKRVLSDIDTRGRDQGFMTRAAMNAPIQGSAADLIKRAMVTIDNRIRKEELPLRMLLQIHDELLFECALDFCAQGMKIVQSEMERVADLAVPLKVEIGNGRNWQQAHS